jgi:endonuclease/exonuclease/phosphatase (EEP) superfamily protein YafD
MESASGQIWFLQLFSVLLTFGICSLGGLTLFGFLGKFWYWFDICNHFRVQYLVSLIASVAASFWIREWALGWLGLAFALINLVVIFPIFILPVGWKRGQPESRLLLANVLRKNHSYNQMLKLIRESQPDLIALVEPDQSWVNALAPLMEQYPYQHIAPRDDNYGLALFSKHPIENQKTHILAGKGTPTLSSDVCWDRRSVRIVLTHPPPPKNSNDSNWRDRQMDNLAELINDQETPVIVCGDFNITPWSPSFRRMERKGKVVDSMRGFGFQATWPADRRWLRVPIDHCLVSPDIQIVQRKVGPKIGSDHLPLIIDFRFNQPVNNR